MKKIEKCSCHLLKFVSSKSVIRKYHVKQTLVELKKGTPGSVFLSFYVLNEGNQRPKYLQNYDEKLAMGKHPFILVITI